MKCKSHDLWKAPWPSGTEGPYDRKVMGSNPSRSLSRCVASLDNLLPVAALIARCNDTGCFMHMGTHYLNWLRVHAHQLRTR